MNKKIVVLIAFIILFFGIVTFYKFEKFDKISEETEEHYFVSSEIKNFKKDDETDINDAQMYSENIIETPLYKVEFNFYAKDTNEKVNGYIYIDDNKELYITDNKKDIIHKVSDIKFKTMYVKDYLYSSSICVNLISEDNKAYLMVLDSNDVTKVIFYDYRYAEVFTNFVEIEYQGDVYPLSNSVFALTEQGKIYNINAGLRYDERTKALYNEIYVHHDNTMTDIYGKIIEDSEGNRYKIKYIFNVSKTNQFLENKANYIIVTEDYKFICFSPDMAFVYEFNKKVKDIKFDKDYPYMEGNLEIIFEDNYKVDLKASCNEYFCINELDSNWILDFDFENLKYNSKES